VYDAKHADRQFIASFHRVRAALGRADQLDPAPESSLFRQQPVRASSSLHNIYLQRLPVQEDL
jgi:hypothetical protein